MSNIIRCFKYYLYYEHGSGAQEGERFKWRTTDPSHVNDWLEILECKRFTEVASESLKSMDSDPELHNRTVCLIYFGMLLSWPTRASEPLTVSLKDKVDEQRISFEVIDELPENM